MSDPRNRPRDLDAFVDRLRAANILHCVEVCGPGNAIVRVNVTGERWEIEFFPTAPPEVEVFRSAGEVHDSGALEGLFERFGDKRA
jgi:hypothetical protein